MVIDALRKHLDHCCDKRNDDQRYVAKQREKERVRKKMKNDDKERTKRRRKKKKKRKTVSRSDEARG